MSACQFAPVAPIQVLEALYEHNPQVFGEYHLLLAHHTIEHLDRFNRLFHRISKDGIISPTVIMDNSVVECGGFVDMGMMIDACSVVSTNCIDVIPVLPDVMGNGQATRCETTKAYDSWVANIAAVGYMAVCQGTDLNDYIESLDHFSNRDIFPLIEFLGIPRVLVGLIGTRRQAVFAALNRLDHHKIHLLGYSDDMQDDLMCSRIDGVHGIDSAVPLRVESQFSFDLEVGPRPKDWFETAELNPLMLANLGHVRQQHGLLANAA